MRIAITLPDDRTKTGTLEVVDETGATVFGPVNCLGKADNATAKKNGNLTRDPLHRFGDTPTGHWLVPRVIPTGTPSLPKHSYGPWGAIDLQPIDGQCVEAYAHGRSGIWIHAGDLSTQSRLRPTFGCVRISDVDQQQLVNLVSAWLAKGSKVPVSIEGTALSVGLKQYQTVDFVASSKGYGTGDEALHFALREQPGNWLLSRRAEGGPLYVLSPWDAAPAEVLDPVLHLDPVPDGFCVVSSSGSIFLKSSDATPKRWTLAPDGSAFFFLTKERQKAHRQPLLEKLQTNLQVPLDDLRGRATVELSLIAAREANRAFPVQKIDQPSENFRGGLTSGATRPVAKWPIKEPECYLPVIAQVEGAAESINAYDLRAGISLGPIQFNVQRGSLLHFLANFLRTDPALWEETLAPLKWSLETSGITASLRTPEGLLDTEKRLVAYLQSKDPSKNGFQDIDASYRRKLAGVFAKIVAWPHVQELLYETSGWWMKDGLGILAESDIEALDTHNPSQESFVLRAILLSSYVRFSGYLSGITAALRKWKTTPEKLMHWPEAVTESVTDPKRRQVLLDRMRHQQQDAIAVFADLLALKPE